MTCFIYISRQEELSQQHKKQTGRKENGNISLPKYVNSFIGNKYDVNLSMNGIKDEDVYNHM
jgi:hypothetical protein